MAGLAGGLNDLQGPLWDFLSLGLQFEKWTYDLVSCLQQKEINLTFWWAPKILELVLLYNTYHYLPGIVIFCVYVLSHTFDLWAPWRQGPHLDIFVFCHMPPSTMLWSSSLSSSSSLCKSLPIKFYPAFNDFIHFCGLKASKCHFLPKILLQLSWKSSHPLLNILFLPLYTTGLQVGAALLCLHNPTSIPYRFPLTNNGICYWPLSLSLLYFSITI